MPFTIVPIKHTERIYSPFSGKPAEIVYRPNTEDLTLLFIHDSESGNFEYISPRISEFLSGESPFEQIYQIPKIEDGIVLQVFSSFEATYSYGFAPHLEDNKLLNEGESKNRISIIAADIERTVDSNYTINLRGKVLLTHQRIPLQHESRDLINHIYDELDGLGRLLISEEGVIEEPRFFSSCELLGFQKFVIENPETFDQLLGDFEVTLQHESTFRRVAGPEQVDQYARLREVERFINSLGFELPNLTSRPLDREFFESDEEFKEVQSITQLDTNLVSAIQNEFRKMRPEQQAIVCCLCSIHDSSLILPMLLANEKIQPSAYALGTMACNTFLAGVFSDVSSSDHHDLFSGYKHDAQVAMEYLRRSTPPEVAELKAIIRGGENKNREFKSSLRNPINDEPVIRNGKILTKNEIKKSLEKAVLKTIAAFMNTEGGTLLIGVQDDGVELGIEHDQFENRDKYQLHLTNIIKQNLGSIAAAAIEIQIISLNSKDICRVDCVKIKDGVYLGGSEFYVRTGPSTTLLSEDQIPRHIQNRI